MTLQERLIANGFSKRYSIKEVCKTIVVLDKDFRISLEDRGSKLSAFYERGKYAYFFDVKPDVSVEEFMDILSSHEE